MGLTGISMVHSPSGVPLRNRGTLLERTDLVMYFIGGPGRAKHEITKLLSRASSLATPWSAARLLLPPNGYKLATPRRRIAYSTVLKMRKNYQNFGTTETPRLTMGQMYLIHASCTNLEKRNMQTNSAKEVDLKQLDRPQPHKKLPICR